jgi:DNA-3-methyladenine glycosylase I
VTDDTWVAADGRRRCGWLPRNSSDFSYHDEVWGTPTHDERALFEALSLGLFEIGMSWSVVFSKRRAFLAAFDQFEPDRVARYTEADVARLVTDRDIIRNRRKIEAVVHNAALVDALTPSFADLVWSSAPAHHQAPASLADVPTTNDEAERLSAELKRAGFTFVGPVSVYAFLQNVGVINDHIQGCFRAFGADGQPGV